MPQLGRYEILQQLATGGVADVLLARASGLEGFQRNVVIKVIRPDLSSDNRFATAFLDEARIAASLHHQNIVQVYDIDEEAGTYFFTMEYVHGEDLRKVLLKVRETNSMMPIDMAIAIATGAAAGLHHAHEQHGPDRKPLGLVHRDVSPGNIILGYDGSVKLVDFGLAKAALRSAKTRVGSLRGKAPYMSPELCCGKPVDRRSDTFALGIVLYELVTARRLFKSGNDFLTMAAIVEGTVEPPSVYRPDLPRQLDEIIMRALAKSPESRYQTADDLRGALESFAIEAELRTSGKAVSDYMKKLFGARAEPWHDQAPPVLDGNIDFDDRAGLVAAPGENASLIAKLGSRMTSPIALAQNVAQDQPDPGLEDDEEPTRHDGAHPLGFETAKRIAAEAAARNAAEAAERSAADAVLTEVPTRIDLPAPTLRQGHKPAAKPAAKPADEDVPTLRSGVQAQAVQDSDPIDDEFITVRQPVPPQEPPLPRPPPRPGTNIEFDEVPLTPLPQLYTDDDVNLDDLTKVSPPLFPVQHPQVVPKIVSIPPVHRVPVAPVAPMPNYRLWIVIGSAIAIPILIVAVAIRECGGKREPATAPQDAAVVFPTSESIVPASESAPPASGSATLRPPRKHPFEKPHRPVGGGAP